MPHRQKFALQWRCLGRRILSAVITTVFYIHRTRDIFDMDSFQVGPIVLSSPSASSLSRDDYCSSSSGSLRSIAIDMINYSSPQGSKSFNKLKHVLDLHSEFFVDLKPFDLFQRNQESMATLLEGYGLKRLYESPAEGRSNVLLVETQFSSSTCPLKRDDCATRGRILIQTEQIGFGYGESKIFKQLMKSCNESPSCIVFEYSDYNYERAVAEPYTWGNSYVLMPVMTQDPSRLNQFLPETRKEIKKRSIDVVLFGHMTVRREFIFQKSKAYTTYHPEKKHLIKMEYDTHEMAKAYSDAKVCLIVHAHAEVTPGEYHRLSEIAAFGCILVVENFADKIGIDRYENCGGLIFADFDHIFETAVQVVEEIDDDLNSYKSTRRHSDWWNAGVKWETILPEVFNIEVPSLGRDE